MKLKSWWLGILFAIGIWWCRVPSALDLLFPHSSLPPVAATQNRDVFATVTTTDRATTERINGDWIGRLILPSPTEIAKFDLTDWVWIELKRAPTTHQQLIGKTLRLTWQPRSPIWQDIRHVNTDIQFTPETIASQKQGNIHPQRLNGRSRVGALQSLAGAREYDDVLVSLTGVKVRTDRLDRSIVEIDREPMQITGDRVALVKILGTDDQALDNLSDHCNYVGCINNFFRIRHYNPNSHKFDGKIETMRFDKPEKRSGLSPSMLKDLERSAAGNRGWYVYGKHENFSTSQFNVNSIQPRSLVELTTPISIAKIDKKIDYIDRQHWEDIGKNKGKLSKVNFIGQTAVREASLSGHRLQEGDRALVIHSFGGIGGNGGDLPGIWQTVTGHFAYGIATVIRSPFTGELEWSIVYNQIYAHNPDGIISGKQDWATYMGNLERGWLGTRPVADLLISYPPVTTDYNFDGIELSPLSELERQLTIAAARYRTGDGTGNASVTPATSCVQDANQALYVTIKTLTDRVRSQPQIQTWLADHPQDPQTLRFRELKSLGMQLETTLTPLGIVRPDWQQNAAKLAGISKHKSFTTSSDPLVGLMSWKTMLPRGAQDGIAKIFTHRDANIWFLNTYQVGGIDRSIYPLAPTVLFGQVPILSKLIIRIWAGITTLPSLSGWLSTCGYLCGYTIVATSIGFKSQFLTFAPTRRSLGSIIRSLIYLLFMPAMIEEIIFRLLLIPHPIETVSSEYLYLTSSISLLLFIIYHPLNALTFFKQGNPTFMDWRFLTLAGLLGITCTIAYLATGSVWSAISIHWLVVVCWLELFGGERRLVSRSTSEPIE